MEEMKQNSVLHVGMKLMGIFFFTQAFMVLPQIFTHIAMVAKYLENGKMPDYYQIHPYWYMLTLGLSLLFLLMFGYFLTIKTEYLIKLLKTPEKIIKFKIHSRDQNLKAWIILIGIYFFISSVPELLKFVWDYLAYKDPSRFSMQNMITAVIGLILAGLFIFFSKVIIDFIKRFEKKSIRKKK